MVPTKYFSKAVRKFVYSKVLVEQLDSTTMHMMNLVNIFSKIHSTVSKKPAAVPFKK